MTVKVSSGAAMPIRIENTLSNVDNTTDLLKPISTATQTALDLKTDETDFTTHTGDTTNPHVVTQTQVGLSNVDNTTDLLKPISTATQTALDLKTDETDFGTHTSDTTNPHVVTKTQVGLSNVDNTTDLLKPISTATQNALNLKTDETDFTTHTGDTTNPHSVTQTQVGLSNVDNTTDLLKPVSTATQTALDLKTDETDFTTHTGNVANPHVVTQTQVGLSNVDNTTDLLKPISTATQTALDLKTDELDFASTITTDQKVEGDGAGGVSFGGTVDASDYEIGGVLALQIPSSGITLVGNAGSGNSGSNVTLVGHEAGLDNTGNSATFIGFETGKDNTVSHVTGLGFRAGKGNTFANTIALGSFALPTNSNQINIGADNALGISRINHFVIVSGSSGAFEFKGVTSTTGETDMGRIGWSWNVSTHASRSADLTLFASDFGGEREGFRIRGTGTASAIGFHGVTPIVRAVLATGASATVDNVITALQNLGLVKQS